MVKPAGEPDPMRRALNIGMGLAAAGCFIAGGAKMVIDSMRHEQTGPAWAPSPPIQSPSPTPDRSQHAHSVGIYLPVSYGAKEYEKIGTNLAPARERIDNLTLAYGKPNTSGTIDCPVISRPLGALITAASKTTSLSLSIGGNDISADAWHAVFADTRRFARSAVDAANALEQKYGRRVHLDLDLSPPNADAVQMRNLIGETHETLKGLLDSYQLTVAVPAERSNLYDTSGDGIGRLVDAFRVKSYDQVTPANSTVAGPIADGQWVEKTITGWIDKLSGDADKIQVGYPSYGYRYHNAKNAGDPFKNPKNYGDGAVAASEIIAKGHVTEDEVMLLSSATLGGDWISFVSPNIVAHIAREIRTEHPNIGGSFFWQASGLTPDHILAAAN